MNTLRIPFARVDNDRLRTRRPRGRRRERRPHNGSDVDGDGNSASGALNTADVVTAANAWLTTLSSQQVLSRDSADSQTQSRDCMQTTSNKEHHVQHHS
jgi:hypothetical protein